MPGLPNRLVPAMSLLALPSLTRYFALSRRSAPSSVLFIRQRYATPVRPIPMSRSAPPGHLHKRATPQTLRAAPHFRGIVSLICIKAYCSSKEIYNGGDV